MCVYVCDHDTVQEIIINEPALGGDKGVTEWPQLLKGDLQYGSMRRSPGSGGESSSSNQQRMEIPKIARIGQAYITLLPVVGNMLCEIVIDRIRSRVDCRLRKEQAGYRKGRGTTEQVFILRNIIEQGNVWQAAHYLNFIDFKKAFDSILLESMRAIMKKYGVPEKIIWMVKIFYEDFKCTVEDQG